ncbi:MAG: RNA 2',3'-cyclic phosphodiesterase [Pararhodobacter sp.]|nr:RNA 2',3'-cyclic phosphodiesterase [Pararhodobacter sp.]
MIRAFLALPLPEPVIAHLALVQQRLRLPRPVPRENFHITLVFLGEQREDLLEELHLALDAMALPGFSLRLDGLAVFGGDSPRNLHAAIAPEPALNQLQSRLRRAAQMSGMTPEKRRFVPHVTLARFRPGEVGAGQLAKAMQEVGAPAATPFVIDRFALYRSHLRADGAQYDILAEYPLRAPGWIASSG